MKRVEVSIGGRAIPLVFDPKSMKGIEEDVCLMIDIMDMISSDRKRVHNLQMCIVHMGNRGLKLDGEQPDLTEEWLDDNMHMGKMKDYQMAVLNAVTEGTKSEVEDGKDRDLVLEEIEKKSE